MSLVAHVDAQDFGWDTGLYAVDTRLVERIVDTGDPDYHRLDGIYLIDIDEAPRELRWPFAEQPE